MLLCFILRCSLSVYKNQQNAEQPKDIKYQKSISHIKKGGIFQVPVMPIFHKKSSAFAAAAKSTEIIKTLNFTDLSRPKSEALTAITSIKITQSMFISE